MTPAGLVKGTSDFIIDQVFPDLSPWEPDDRPPLQEYQRPPKGKTPGVDWNLWLFEAGRGAGKTESCARYCASYMRKHPEARGRIIAPTFGDAVEACILGPSGLKQIDPTVKWMPSSPGGAKVRWPNGAEMLVIGTNSPRDVERLRAGGNRELDWWEEMAANPQLKAAWDQAAFGLRKGQTPHAVASTTPRNTTEYRAIRNLSGTHLTRASLFDNKYLPKVFVDAMIKKYEGTRLGRQELRGELLDDIEGALWNRNMIEDAREWNWDLPEMSIIVVAIDPAVTSNEESDDTGIMVAGLGTDGDGYLLDDQTCHLSPENWGIRVDRVWRKHRADYVVGEANNGGDMVEAIILAANPRIPYKKVIASRGKQTRAQPISALYGDGRKRPSRIHHVGNFPELEDQLCTWVPGEEDSPDRLDALVWAITELFFGEHDYDETVEYYEPVEIGADI